MLVRGTEYICKLVMPRWFAWHKTNKLMRCACVKVTCMERGLVRTIAVEEHFAGLGSVGKVVVKQELCVWMRRRETQPSERGEEPLANTAR